MPFEHDAFISYRRSDGSRAARWLRRALLRYKLPPELRSESRGKLRVYLDTVYEKATEDFFTKNIEPALKSSRYLIVVATPDSLKPRSDGRPNWVEREIETFRATPQGRNILATRAGGDLTAPLPGDLWGSFPNLEIVSLRGLTPLRFILWPRWWRLRDELLKVAAPLFDITAEEMPVLRREERNRRLRGVWLASLFSLLLLSAMTALAGWALWEYSAAEKSRAAEHAAQVDALLKADPQAVPDIIRSLTPVNDDVLVRLRAQWGAQESAESHPRRLRAGLALLALSPPDAGAVKGPLYEAMLKADDPLELLLVRDGLRPYGAELKDDAWGRVDKADAGDDARFRALVALAAFDAESGRWQKAGEAAVARLVETNPLHLGPLAEALRPVRASLIGPLAAVFRDSDRAERRQVAASLLAEYAADQTETLVGLIQEADAEQFKKLFPLLLLDQHRGRAVELLSLTLSKGPTPDAAGRAPGDVPAKAQARAGAALVQLGRADLVWPLLRRAPDPTLRTYLLHELGPLGADPGVLVERLKAEPDVSARRALILSLGEFTGEQLPASLRDSLTPLLLKWYRDDPDSGIHGAVDWLLRYGKRGGAPRRCDWGQAAALKRIDRESAGRPPQGRNWYVTKEGQPMAVVRGPATFQMSAAPGGDGGLFKKQIKRTFAVATKEVTVGQFKRFLEDEKLDYPQEALDALREFAPEDDAPMLTLSWFAAAKYCNWLSKREGLPECYVFRLDGAINLEDYTARPCYRLPTEAEWEYVARAGSTTDWFYGSREELLKEYAWYMDVSNNRVWPVGQLKPNDLGFFDVYGNAAELLQDRVGVEYMGRSVGDPFLDMRRLRTDDDVADSHTAVDPNENRMIRGGSFSDRSSETKSSARNYFPAGRQIVNFGLRVARTLSADAPK